ncbi:asparagine synthase family protein [Sphingobium yanoikuyae]|uniref:asparagine synthase-related protein n=1 Tax=Sphingobium yanoikuyae TaxID=13690 RepID=UPI0022DE30A5|nr:asparagine synthetase B family protein [Sphingobium yanoikuyae]WBQ17673.1 asparagine synthetase B family protein [Sphingobium yanoikuyae]
MSIGFLVRLKPRGSVIGLQDHRAAAPEYLWEQIGTNISVGTDSPGKLTLFPGDRGFLIGSLYHRHGPAEPVSTFPTDEMDKIWATRGQHLVESYWGCYVAVIIVGSSVFVLRDPSGALPCYFSASAGIATLASEPRNLAKVGLLTSGIDCVRLGRALLLGGLPEQRTALSDVQELLPGMCLTIEGALLSTSSRWDPWHFAANDAGRSFDEHAERLRRAIEACVGGWSKQFDKPLLSISGGLDSSIVGACMKKFRREFACITMTTDDPMGDESTYSRQLSEHIGKNLFDERFLLDDVSLDRSSVSHMPKPFGRLDANAFDAAVARIAKQEGADAIFTGNGGDNVFFMSRSARPLADRYLKEGVSPGIFATARDIHRLTGAGIFHVFAQGFRAWRNSTRSYEWRTEATLLSRDIIAAAKEGGVHHPWLCPSDKGGLPGKAAHIAMLVRMHYSLSAYSKRDGIPVIHPLASQPILECCLQIPTWQQCNGGIDRSVARNAFSAMLPPTLIARRVKGSPHGFSFQIFARYREEIRERLLDGYLANNGILERRDVERMFLPNRKINVGEITRLLMLVDAEAWTRHWQSNLVSSAPAS